MSLFTMALARALDEKRCVVLEGADFNAVCQEYAEAVRGPLEELRQQTAAGMADVARTVVR